MKFLTSIFITLPFCPIRVSKHRITVSCSLVSNDWFNKLKRCGTVCNVAKQVLLVTGDIIIIINNNNNNNNNNNMNDTITYLVHIHIYTYTHTQRGRVR